MKFLFHKHHTLLQMNTIIGLGLRQAECAVVLPPPRSRSKPAWRCVGAASCYEWFLQALIETLQVSRGLGTNLNMACSSEKLSSWPSQQDGVCTICLHDFQDARLLPCLHSFCRACIDRLSLTDSTSDDGVTSGSIECPVCREVCILPATGAQELLEDFSHSCGTPKNRNCSPCENESGRQREDDEALLFCRVCEEWLCPGHTIKHLSTPGEHVFGTPGDSDKSAASQSASGRESLGKCSVHRQPLRFFCEQCNAAVCGDCTTIGAHQGHKAVVYVHVAVAKKREKVSPEVEKLRSEVQPRLEEAVQSVVDSSARLVTNTSTAKSEINACAQRAICKVEKRRDQLLQNVDDLQTIRLKALDKQKDELEARLRSVKNIVRFNDRVEGASHVDSLTELRMIEMIETRCAALESSDQSDLDPCESSSVSVRLPGDGSLSAGIERSLPSILPCDASASRSSVRRSWSTDMCPIGKESTVVLELKDGKGRTCEDVDENIITAVLLRAPEEEQDVSQPCPDIHVKKRDSGEVELSLIPTEAGLYRLQVEVNGESVGAPLEIPVDSYKVRFDPGMCQSGVKLSADLKTASLDSHSYVYSSVLGVDGMTFGRHSWTIQIGPDACDHGFGVAAKPLSMTKDNYRETFSWDSGAMCYSAGMTLPRRDEIGELHGNEKLRLTLDCDLHTLEVENLSTGEVGHMDGLPGCELFPWFSLCYAGNKITIL